MAEELAEAIQAQIQATVEKEVRRQSGHVDPRDAEIAQLRAELAQKDAELAQKKSARTAVPTPRRAAAVASPAPSAPSSKRSTFKCRKCDTPFAKDAKKGPCLRGKPGCGWDTVGPFMGYGVRRSMLGNGGTCVGVDAQIVGYLPIDKADFKDAAGKPAALWKICYADNGPLAGDYEDLEEHEVREGMYAWAAAPAMPMSMSM